MVQTIFGASRVWAMQVRNGRLWTLRQAPRFRSYHGPATEPSFTGEVSTLLPEGDTPDTRALHFFGEDELEHTSGMGAIFENGDVAVATTDRRLFVYPDTNDDVLAARARRPFKLPFAPYDISITSSDRIALLEAAGVTLDPLGERGPYSIRDELFLAYPERKGTWPTVLRVLDRKGRLLESTTVPFPVLQPPIDGERGRTYLAGIGFAAVEAGRIVFTHPSKHVCLATAMLGGNVVLATGEELRFIARDGTIRHVIRVPPGETITTPPAIGHDGAVWIATEKTLYVAR